MAELSVAAKQAGGSRVPAKLPVERPNENSYVPTAHRHIGALPTPEEASADGSFGRESFLRALVVQLAQTVEQRDGPDGIEETVSQAGTDVGGRMEAEYRRAREIVGRLDSKQLGISMCG